MFLLAFSVSLFAQDSLSVRLAQTENKIHALDKALQKLPKISGFINTQYTFDRQAETNSFSIRRARLDLKGNLSKIVDYRLQADFSNAPKLVDAFVRLKFSPYIGIQIGQFKMPFSLETPYSPLKMAAIDNAQVISKLSGYKDLSGSHSMGRDMGVALYGGFFHREGYNIVDYNIGLFNGNGVNTKDNNKHKDFIGRIEIHPIKAITLSASVYRGKMNDEVKDLVPKDRYALSFRYDDSRFLFRAEYLRGKTNEKKTEGYYGIVGYRLSPKFLPVLRYDYYREDLSVANNRSNFYMAGIDYWPWKFVRLQLNYTLKQIQADDKFYGLVGGMVTVKF